MGHAKGHQKHSGRFKALGGSVDAAEFSTARHPPKMYIDYVCTYDYYLIVKPPSHYKPQIPNTIFRGILSTAWLSYHPWP